MIYKTLRIKEPTHKRFCESVEYGKTHDTKLNELLDEHKTSTSRRIPKPSSNKASK